MPRFAYTTAALKDLCDIATFIAEAAGNSAVALAYTGRLRGKCQELADLPFPVGRARPELILDLRSYAYGSHIIFFRCRDGGLIVVAIIEGHRDISRFFGTQE